MNYSNYQAEDFFNDPVFRQWVLQPDPELNFFWEKWLLNHPSKEETIREARLMTEKLYFKEHQWENKEKLWQKIKDNTATAKSGSMRALPAGDKPRSDHFKSWMKAAAVILLLVSSYFIFLDYRQQQTNIPGEQALVQKINPNGQKSKIHLPDGSIVYLNANSSLSYPAQFDSLERNVTLEGEAFFEVVKNETAPFTVNTGKLKTKVLGTAFNVFHRNQQQDSVVVALVEGKVQLLKNNDVVELDPGEAAWAYQDNDIKTGRFDYLEVAAWKDGILFFNDKPLYRAFETLEQWYGVRFSFNRKPEKSVLVTGKFQDEYLNNVLQAISYAARFDYEIKGDSVEIKFN